MINKDTTEHQVSSDIWENLDNLRIDQTANNQGAAKKLLTTVPVRKPGKQDFATVHPSRQITAGLLEIEGTRETYLVLPNVAVELVQGPDYRLATLFQTINRQKILSLWPVYLQEEGRSNDWRTSMLEAAERAVKTWVRVAANMSLGAYEISEALADCGDPVWPEFTFNQILKIAFKNKVIETVDHPAIQSLHGLV